MGRLLQMPNVRIREAFTTPSQAYEKDVALKRFVDPGALKTWFVANNASIIFILEHCLNPFMAAMAEQRTMRPDSWIAPKPSATR